MKLKKKIIVILLGIYLSPNVFSQVTIGSGAAPISGALLQLKDDGNYSNGETAQKGLGLPLVSLIALNQLEPCVETNDENKKLHIGLVVYNINTTNPLKQGVYIWNGNLWVRSGAENGLTMNGQNIALGGELNTPTTITGSDVNTLSLDVNTTIDQSLAVSGEASLNKTTISMDDNNSFVVSDNRVLPKKGYYLRAKDDGGTVEWAEGAGTLRLSAEMTAGGVTYNPTDTGGKLVNTGSSITLPTGKWIIQIAALFQVQGDLTGKSFSIAQNHWVQISLWYKNTSGTFVSATKDLASGVVFQQLRYNVINGYFILENTTSDPIEYVFYAYPAVLSSQGSSWDGTNYKVKCFDSANSENTIIAISLD